MPKCERAHVHGWPHLVTVLHKLGQVEQGLRDLSDVLRGESQLDAADQFVLLVLTQLRPAGQEGGIEQVPGRGEEGGSGDVTITGAAWRLSGHTAWG